MHIVIEVNKSNLFNCDHNLSYFPERLYERKERLSGLWPAKENYAFSKYLFQFSDTSGFVFLTGITGFRKHDSCISTLLTSHILKVNLSGVNVF